MAQAQPKWLQLTEELLSPISAEGLEILNPKHAVEHDLASVAYCALIHFRDCFQTINNVNLDGKHSVAICLLRQAVESLTLIDLGLQQDAFSHPLILEWQEGKRTQGQLRAELERHVWHRYGTGLWDETWAEFVGNLARAVQPYAHYTHELMGWQITTVGHHDGDKFYAIIGPNNYDPIKASRITLLMAITGWTLCRRLLASGRCLVTIEHSHALQEWGKALGDSKLLFRSGKWGSQSLPHLFFQDGLDWIDD